MEKLSPHLSKKQYTVGYILFSAFYVFVSLTTFYGVRLFYPILVYEGRTSLYTLPAVFTYLVPLLSFYLILLSMYAKTIKGRLRFVATLGYSLLALSIFNLLDITLCITLLFDGKTLVNFTTPAFPLDVILFNVIYFLGAIGCLMYRRIDKKYVLSVGTSRIPLSNAKMIVAGLFLPIATYFFGQFLHGFMFITETFLDSNWHYMIPHYLSFLLPTVYFGLYMGTRFQKDYQKRRKLADFSMIFMYVTLVGTLIWMYASIFMNPYLLAESLQWEYALGLCIKVPLGMFVTTITLVTIVVVATIRYVKFKDKKEETNEQEQAKI